MPKVVKNRKLSRVARRVAASDPLPTPAAIDKDEHSKDGDDDDEPNTSQSLSRGQRKRQAKKDQYLKKENMILSTLMLQKQDEQKRRIDGLDAIREALLDTTKNSETKEEPVEEHNPTYGTNRSRKGLMNSEIERMGLVMEHPAFKKNPFEAIQEHLKNTLAGQKEKRDQEAKKKEERDRVKKEVKKQEKKERLQGVKKSRKKYKPRRSK
jgi:hypothetical protein